MSLIVSPIGTQPMSAIVDFVRENAVIMIVLILAGIGVYVEKISKDIRAIRTMIANESK
jgi:hypothetical protein